MAIAARKRIEKTPGYQRKKRFFKRLVGKELRLKNDIDVASIKDGSKSDVMYTMIAEEETLDDVIEVPAYSLSTIAEKLGHQHIDLLKMDIEGAGYEVLDDLPASPIKAIQLLVEFHHRCANIGLEKTADVFKRLRDDGYKIFAISETGREVSFLRV